MTSTISPTYSTLPLSLHGTLSTTDSAKCLKKCCVGKTEDNVERRQLQCDNYCTCYMCDRCAENNERGTCKWGHGVQELKRSMREFCKEMKDTSWKMDLFASQDNDKEDSLFQRVVYYECAYECAKGENEEWMVPVKGHEPRKCVAVISAEENTTLLALRYKHWFLISSMHRN